MTTTKNKTKIARDNSYSKPITKPPFELAPHHKIAYTDLFHRFSLALEQTQADNALRLLRSPSGYPIVREHGDLKPGEISLVLR